MLLHKHYNAHLWIVFDHHFPKLLFHRDGRNVWNQVSLCFHVHNPLWYQQVRFYRSSSFFRRTTRVSNNGHIDIIQTLLIHPEESWRKAFLRLGFQLFQMQPSVALWIWSDQALELFSEKLLFWAPRVEKTINIEPHEAAPEVSRSKVHITQNKHVPIEIDCDLLNTFHSISHATLSWCWLERRSKKNYSVLLGTTPVLLQYYSVLRSITPVLQSTTPVLQSTSPVLLCTTKHYSSTTRYYKALHPALLCTTKYYSSTTLYYKVPLQY